MIFVLQKAKLWEHISEIAMRPLKLKSWSDNDEDQ